MGDICGAETAFPSGAPSV